MDIDTTAPEDRPTVPAPAMRDGVLLRPCGFAFCGFTALPGTMRCERHNHRPLSMPRLPALLCEQKP